MRPLCTGGILNDRDLGTGLKLSVDRIAGAGAAADVHFLAVGTDNKI